MDATNLPISSFFLKVDICLLSLSGVWGFLPNAMYEDSRLILVVPGVCWFATQANLVTDCASVLSERAREGRWGGYQSWRGHACVASPASACCCCCCCCPSCSSYLLATYQDQVVTWSEESCVHPSWGHPSLADRQFLEPSARGQAKLQWLSNNTISHSLSWLLKPKIHNWGQIQLA